MKAAPNAQKQLLDLQEIDSKVLQLRHRRANLPEITELKSLESGYNEVLDRARDARIVVADLKVEQAKAEADVEQVRTRRARDRKRIDEGQITNPKDLTRLNHEMDSLERRVATLEDEELEVMEKLEAASADLEKVEQELAAFDQRVADLEAARDAEQTSIDEQIAKVEASRAGAAEPIPADLLALYERLREQKGGLAAALFTQGECGGCRMKLDHAELASVRSAAPDEVVRCEDCSRIMVRTAESGL